MIASIRRVALLAILLVGGSGIAWAQVTKPIRFIVPFSAGGVTDQSARVIADKMAQTLGQSIIIENRPGAGGRIGINAVASAAPDGMTVLFTNIGYSILAVVEPKIPFDPVKTLTPVTTTSVYGMAVVTANKVPAKTLPEFIEYAKKNPGKLSYGSAGPGSGSHFGGELLKVLTGTDLVHVPYRSNSQAMNDVASGTLELGFEGAVKPWVDGGKVRLLAVTGNERDPRFPEIPTVAEAGLPALTVVAWGGLFLPPGASPALVERFNKAANQALADPSVRRHMAVMGQTPQGGTPEQFIQRIRTDLALFRKIATDANLKFD